MMPPTPPLPVRGPPLAVAKTSPPLTTAISPATRATMAPILPLPVPIRPAERARASPPMTTPTSASTAAVVAQSRSAVGVYASTAVHWTETSAAARVRTKVRIIGLVPFIGYVFTVAQYRRADEGRIGRN